MIRKENIAIYRAKANVQLHYYSLHPSQQMNPRRLAPVEEKEDNFTRIALFLFPAARVCMAIKI